MSCDIAIFSICLDDWANMATIAQALFVIVSLFFIFQQLRQNAKLAKAANARAIAEQAGSFNSTLWQNPELVKLWYGYGRDIKNSCEADQRRYREMLVQWLIFHENLFYQKEQKLLDESYYIPWEQDLKTTVKKHNVKLVWDSFPNQEAGGFGHHLRKLREETTV